MSKYAIKKKNNATGDDESNLTATGRFIALKAEVGKLYFNSFLNVPTDFKNLKRKVDNYMLLI